MQYSVHPIIQKEEGLPCIVCGIGEQHKQCHIQRKEGYPLHQLVFSIKGKGLLKVHQQTYEINEGDYFYLKPNEPHEYYALSKEWSTNWILFRGNQIKSLLYTLGFKQSKAVYFGTNYYVKLSFQEILMTLKSQNKLSGYVASSQLYSLLVQLYGTAHEQLETVKNKKNLIIEPLLKYIDEMYCEELTLETLASVVNVSPQHICKVFKEKLDIRPFEYIAKRRIQEAKKLLLNSSLNISKIGQKVGYNDSSYFCATFKRYEFVSPSTYRGTLQTHP